MKIKAHARLTARDYGDVPPSTWMPGDVDVTFTPFCQVVRKVLGSEVAGISGSKQQEWLWVYVDSVKAKSIPLLDKELKRASIPGSPRFNSITIAQAASYKGMLVLKYRIY